MTLTLEQAKALRPGMVLVDWRGKRWKVNGQVKLWKKDPTRIHVPLKHGLYAYDSIDTGDFQDGVCKHVLTIEGS